MKAKNLRVVFKYDGYSRYYSVQYKKKGFWGKWVEFDMYFSFPAGGLIQGARKRAEKAFNDALENGIDDIHTAEYLKGEQND